MALHSYRCARDACLCTPAHSWMARWASVLHACVGRTGRGPFPTSGLSRPRHCTDRSPWRCRAAPVRELFVCLHMRVPDRAGHPRGMELTVRPSWLQGSRIDRDEHEYHIGLGEQALTAPHHLRCEPGLDHSVSPARSRSRVVSTSSSQSSNTCIQSSRPPMAVTECQTSLRCELRDLRPLGLTRDATVTPPPACPSLPV